MVCLTGYTCRCRLTCGDLRSSDVRLRHWPWPIWLPVSHRPVRPSSVWSRPAVSKYNQFMLSVWWKKVSHFKIVRTRTEHSEQSQWEKANFGTPPFKIYGKSMWFCVTILPLNVGMKLHSYIESGTGIICTYSNLPLALTFWKSVNIFEAVTSHLWRGKLVAYFWPVVHSASLPKASYCCWWREFLSHGAI